MTPGQLTFPHPDFDWRRLSRRKAEHVSYVVKRARAYLAARADVEGADSSTMLDAIRRRDIALHDLTVAAGVPCECAPDTCPGYIVDL